jgi:hypothetical protein
VRSLETRSHPSCANPAADRGPASGSARIAAMQCAVRRATGRLHRCVSPLLSGRSSWRSASPQPRRRHRRPARSRARSRIPKPRRSRSASVRRRASHETTGARISTSPVGATATRSTGRSRACSGQRLSMPPCCPRPRTLAGGDG